MYPAGVVPARSADLAHTLNRGDVHVWCARYREFDIDVGAIAQNNVLSESELDNLRRFHFDDDKIRYCVTRTLVRTVLSKYAPIEPRDWMFHANPYGRPQIANTLDTAHRVSFNVSHTKGVIVLAISRHSAIGVDVEGLRRRDISADIADHHFARSEVTQLRRLSQDEWSFRFFEFWTLKESYIKARGMGLSLPLDGFSFDLTTACGVGFMIRSELHDQAERWCFTTFNLYSDFIVAVCTECSVEHSGFCFFEYVPGASVRTIVPPFLRTSQFDHYG